MTMIFYLQITLKKKQLIGSFSMLVLKEDEVKKYKIQIEEVGHLADKMKKFAAFFSVASVLVFLVIITKVSDDVNSWLFQLIISGLFGIYCAAKYLTSVIEYSFHKSVYETVKVANVLDTSYKDINIELNRLESEIKTLKEMLSRYEKRISNSE